MSNSYKIQLIRNNLDETKDIMSNNIEQLIDRGEKLEDLEIKSKDMCKEAELFKATCKNASNAYRRDNYKLFAVGGSIILSIGGIATTLTLKFLGII